MTEPTYQHPTRSRTKRLAYVCPICLEPYRSAENMRACWDSHAEPGELDESPSNGQDWVT